MQRPKVISLQWLDERGACREQVQLFARVWPDGVAVTRETLEQSATAGLRLEWFAGQVLPRSDYTAFQSQRATLYAALQSQRATLYAAYQEQVAPQYADYKMNADYKLNADYLAHCDTLGAAYRAQRDTLLINAVCDSYERENDAVD